MYIPIVIVWPHYGDLSASWFTVVCGSVQKNDVIHKCFQGGDTLHPEGSRNENFTDVKGNSSFCQVWNLLHRLARYVRQFRFVFFSCLCLCGSVDLLHWSVGAQPGALWLGRQWGLEMVHTGQHEGWKIQFLKRKFEVVRWEKIGENRRRGQDVVIDGAGESEMKSEAWTFEFIPRACV